MMETNKPEFSKKEMWWAITKTAVVVFVGTMIYARFLTTELKTQALENANIELEFLVNELKEELNGRIDRKTIRIEEDVKKNSAEIEKLKLPNTDGQE